MHVPTAFFIPKSMLILIVTVKSFLSEQEAWDFVAGRPTSGASASSKTQGDRFYGVAVGKIPGIYTDWGAASEQIKDVKGPKFKKFSTMAEAQAFVRSGGKSSTVVATKNKDGEPTLKKAKKSKAPASNKNIIVVYTDGSSRGNGKKGAFAGVGVFFGEDDDR
jgi:ribonuclease HI